MWEIVFPALTVEVCVTSIEGLHTESFLFSLAHLGDLVSAEGPALTSSRAGPSLRVSTAAVQAALGELPHIAERHTLAQAVGGFVFFLCLF